jgi:hypothetical protein
MPQLLQIQVRLLGFIQLQSKEKPFSDPAFVLTTEGHCNL